MRCSSRRSAGAAALLLAIAAAAAIDARAGQGVAGAGAPVLLRPEAARVAVLPVVNLSGNEAPIGAFQQWLIERLDGKRIPLLDDMELRAFMRRNRMRDMGGLSGGMGRALREETGASAVLVSSIDLYDESIPPRFAMTGRLVSADGEPRILWMDSADRVGDEAPGFLAMGEIENRIAVQRLVVERLVESLVRYLRTPSAGGGSTAGVERVKERYAPKSFYRAAAIVPPPAGRLRVAVLPFDNGSTTRRAAEILTLQVIRHLVAAGAAEIVEPGVVRQALLRQRLIQEEGLSIPQADLLRQVLGADIALFGEVSEYRETGAGTAEPEVEFSVRAIDTAARQVVWSSESYGEGDDGVVFFDAGRIPTAHRLADRMAAALVERILPSLEVSP